MWFVFPCSWLVFLRNKMCRVPVSTFGYYSYQFWTSWGLIWLTASPKMHSCRPMGVRWGRISTRWLNRFSRTCMCPHCELTLLTIVYLIVSSAPWRSLGSCGASNTSWLLHTPGTYLIYIHCFWSIRLCGCNTERHNISNHYCIFGLLLWVLYPCCGFSKGEKKGI